MKSTWIGLSEHSPHAQFYPLVRPARARLQAGYRAEHETEAYWNSCPRVVPPAVKTAARVARRGQINQQNHSYALCYLLTSNLGIFPQGTRAASEYGNGTPLLGCIADHRHPKTHYKASVVGLAAGSVGAFVFSQQPSPWAMSS
jgi:hypothetical protein